MIIGAQLFSVKEQMKTEEEIYSGFKRLSEMGYKAAHVSGIGTIDPKRLKEISDEFNMPVTVTHTPPERLFGEIDKVIEEHKILGCPIIGFSWLPPEARDGTFDSFKKYYDKLKDVSDRIEDAGLKFGYHNHRYEFEKMDIGISIYDYLIEENSTWEFIADICWIRFAGWNVEDTIRRIKGRVSNAHLKDIRKIDNEKEKDFCPLGEGLVDIVSAAKVLKECGCLFAHVEQDNASKKPEPFGEMEKSINYLKKQNILEV